MFKHIKVGDMVVRNFCGKLQPMQVTEVTQHLITAGMGWMFDRETGWEEDPDIGWGISYGVTGSFLVQSTGDIHAAQKQKLEQTKKSPGQETSPTGSHVQVTSEYLLILSESGIPDNS